MNFPTLMTARVMVPRADLLRVIAGGYPQDVERPSNDSSAASAFTRVPMPLAARCSTLVAVPTVISSPSH